MCLRRRLSGGIQCRSTALCGNAARSSSVLLASRRSLSYTHCHCLKARARAGKPASPSVSVKNSSHQHNSDWTVSEGEPVLQTTSISINPFARIAPPPKAEVPTGRIPGYSILKPKTWVSSWGTIVKPKYVGHHLTTIELDQLQLFREDVTCASGHEVIASYSHVGTTGTIPRKIFVPGGPAVYQKKDLPKVLSTPKMSYIEAGSPFLSPSESTKPMLQAIKYMKPDFYLDDIDVWSSSGPLMSLLAFCNGEARKNVFLYAAVIHDTLIIDRFRYPNTADIKGFLSDQHMPQEVSPNFGMRFEEDFTKWPKGLEESRSHTRIIKYRIGNLNCMLPVGVDACWEPASEEVKSALPEGQHLVNPYLGSDTVIIPRGVANHSPTVEIKSGTIDVKHWPQMWFSRNQKMLRANVFKLGKDGSALVDAVHVSDATVGILEWESLEQVPLRRLATLLHRLREIVQESSYKHCFISQVMTPGAPLEVFEARHNDRPVPDHIVPSFWRAGPRDTPNSSPSGSKAGSKPQFSVENDSQTRRDDLD